MSSLRAWYHYYASLAYQTEGRTIPQDRTSITVYTQRLPYGVVGVIPAFNSFRDVTMHFPVSYTEEDWIETIRSSSTVTVRLQVSGQSSVQTLARSIRLMAGTPQLHRASCANPPGLARAKPGFYPPHHQALH